MLIWFVESEWGFRVDVWLFEWKRESLNGGGETNLCPAFTLTTKCVLSGASLSKQACEHSSTVQVLSWRCEDVRSTLLPGCSSFCSSRRRSSRKTYGSAHIYGLNCEPMFEGLPTCVYVHTCEEQQTTHLGTAHLTQ